MAACGLPQLNKPAPDFESNTTSGVRKLSDYKGRWLVLFSHPADFTPVCTTEFMAFARAYDQFQALNCDLLGLSIDSNFAHIAWMRSIKEKFDVEIPFPVIEDLSMKVAHAYGMIQPGASDTSAMRATFFVDPEGVLRAMVYYPMSNGRPVDEFLRLLKGLQTSDEHGVATSENWQLGEKVIVPPPATAKAADLRPYFQPFKSRAVVSTELTKRNKATDYENAALDLFGRLNRERESPENKWRTSDSADAILQAIDA